MTSIYLPIGSGKQVLVDVEDTHFVTARNWSYMITKGREYAFTKIDGKTTYLHRMIMGFPVELEVDHRNGDGLDNRRSNLRTATHAQNLANQRLQTSSASGYKGVNFDRRKKSKPWYARTKFMGKKVWIGVFATAEEAAKAYDLKVRELYGDYANTNF